jgi:hypothetical protein
MGRKRKIDYAAVCEYALADPLQPQGAIAKHYGLTQSQVSHILRLAGIQHGHRGHQPTGDWELILHNAGLSMDAGSRMASIDWVIKTMTTKTKRVKYVSYLVSNDSEVYDVLNALGVIPDNCTSLTYTLDVNKLATITYECFATEEIDAAIADAIDTDAIDITSLGDTEYAVYERN